MYSRTYGAAVHKSNIRVKRWHNKYENSDDIFALFLVNLDFNVIHWISPLPVFYFSKDCYHYVIVNSLQS